MQQLQADRDLFQRSVAGAFAQAIDRGVDVGGPGEDRGQTVGGGQAEVVVGVHLQFEVGALPQTGEDGMGPERLQDADGVREAERLAPAASAASITRSRKSTSARDASSPPTHTSIPSSTPGAPGRDLVAGPGAIAAELVPNLLVGDRTSKDRPCHAEVPAGAQVVLPHPAPDEQPRRQPGRGTARILSRSSAPMLGNADFQLRNAGGIEIARDGHFLVEGEATPADCSPSRRVVSSRT